VVVAPPDAPGRFPPWPRPPCPNEHVAPETGSLTAILVAVTAPLLSALPWTTAHWPTTSAAVVADARLVKVVESPTVTVVSVTAWVDGSVREITMLVPDTEATVPLARLPKPPPAGAPLGGVPPAPPVGAACPDGAAAPLGSAPPGSPPPKPVPHCPFSGSLSCTVVAVKPVSAAAGALVGAAELLVAPLVEPPVAPVPAAAAVMHAPTVTAERSVFWLAVIVVVSEKVTVV